MGENGVRVTPPLNGRDWKYVAEGGANVLFRHHAPEGTSSSIAQDSGDAVAMDFKGKLLRVKKCDIDDKATASAKHKKKPKKAAAALNEKPYVPNYPHPRDVLQYATNEIMPYLVQQVASADALTSSKSKPLTRAHASSKQPRSCFLQVAELIEVDQSFLAALNEQLLTLESRPAHRRHSQIDVSLKCVMVLPDVTLPPPDDTSLLFSEDDLDIPADALVPDADVGNDDDDDAMTAGSVTDLTDEEHSDALMLDDDDVSAMRLVARNSDDSGADTDDGMADELHDDVSSVPPTPLALTVAPRLRRLLSSYHRNIFDCCFRNICVEIKPKIGFKPKGPLTPLVKKQVCRFCMHQHFKKARGKVEEISQYCPLDLFSREPARIRKALRALQRTPQNNFKVFVRSKQDEVVNVITGLSADALPKGAAQSRYSYCRRKRMGFRRSCHSIGAENEIHLSSSESATERFDDARDQLIPDVVELITEVLMRIEILDDLKQMQLLDDISVDGVWHIQLLLQRLELLVARDKKPAASVAVGDLVAQLRDVLAQRDREERELDNDVERAGSLARCLAFLRLALHHLPDADAVRGVARWEELSLAALQAFYQQLLQRFQVATTLKDCSLLLCLRRSVDDRSSCSAPSGTRSPCSSSAKAAKPKVRFEHLREFEHAVAFRDMTFNCVVAVVDLDVKSHKSVDDYYRLDEKIVDNFVREFGALEHELCRE